MAADDAGLRPGWFRDSLRRARETVDGWSPSKREAFARMPRSPRRDTPRCPRPSACDEAQTCVGGCGLHNTRGL